MNTPVAGLSGASTIEGCGCDGRPGPGGSPDSLAAVAAHRAMNSLAFVAGALAALQEGKAACAEEREQLLSRAITHTGVISALLYDLVLGLPLGASALPDRAPLREAEQRFGVRAGS